MPAYSFKQLQNENNDNKDFVILTIPLLGTSMPLMAPAVLKPIIESANVSCLAIDINAEIQNIVDNHKYKDDLTQIFTINEYDNEDVLTIYHSIINDLVDQILAWNPKYVGLSLLVHTCQSNAQWVAYLLKKKNPDVKVIIGGPGCHIDYTSEPKWINFLKHNNLIDYYIKGDAERSLLELLQDNTTYIGINDIKWKELDNEELSQTPIPNFDDYDFSIYPSKTISIIGSRGCVRKCTFCNYIDNWKTFHWRDAENIFNEMMYQYKKHNVTQFRFQDTLLNGNMTEFNKLIRLIAEHNEANPDAQFSWSGFYIFRNVTSRSETEWEYIKRSNGEFLAVGIESFNEDIRYHMGKKFSNESIDFHIDQAYKHNITLSILLIVGYVFETREHVDFTKQWLTDHAQYKSIISLTIAPLGIFEGTWLHKNHEELGVILGNEEFSWTHKDYENTPELRISWYQEIKQHAIDLGYHISRSDSQDLQIDVFFKRKNSQ